MVVKLSELNVEAKLELAAGCDTSGDVLTRLCRDGDAGVRVTAACNPRLLALDLFKFLSSQKVSFGEAETVYRNVMFNTVTFSENVDKLSKTGLRKLVSRKFLDEKFLRVIVDKFPDDEPLMVIVGKHRNADIDLLRRLAGYNQVPVMLAVAGNRNVDAEILDELSYCGVESVRERVSSRGETSPETLERLSDDPSLWVRGNVAKRSNTPVHVLEKMMTQVEYEYVTHVDERSVNFSTGYDRVGYEMVELMANILANKKCPQRFLTKYADSDSIRLLGAIMNNPATTTQILCDVYENVITDNSGKLGVHRNYPLRVIAAHRKCDEQLYMKLLSHNDEKISKTIAGNKHAPGWVKDLANLTL